MEYVSDEIRGMCYSSGHEGCYFPSPRAAFSQAFSVNASRRRIRLARTT